MLKTENIIPSIDGKYISSQDAKIVRGKELVDLFEGKKLCGFLNQPNAMWLSKEFTKDNYGEFHKYFISELKIKEIGPDDLSLLIKNNPNYLKNVDIEWLKLFYTYLGNKVPSLLNVKAPREHGSLITTPFIKTINGEIHDPYEMKLVGTEYKLESKIYQKPKDEIAKTTDFLFIDSYIQNNCSVFIDVLNIKEPDKLDYFINELKNISKNELNDDIIKVQTKKALQYLKSDYEKIFDLFKDLLWFNVITNNGKYCYITLKDSNIYRENDYNGISIKDYYENVNCNVFILNEQFYLKNNFTIEDLKYLEKLGIINNIYRDLHTIRWNEGYNIDDFRKKLSIKNIDNVLNYIKFYPHEETSQLKSKIIISLLMNIEKHLKGIYFKYSSGKFESVSDIIKCLRNNDHKWIFGKNGLVNSREISHHDLDINIYGVINSNSIIFEILKFKKTEDEKQAEIINYILSKYSNEQLEYLIKNYLPEEQDIEFDPTKEEINEIFPENEINDFEKTIDNIRYKYKNAKEVTYESVQRRVRTSRGKDKERLGYIYNGFCQSCEKKYNSWEVAEILNSPEKEIEEMNLSFCPICAAEYRILRNNNEIMKLFKDKIINTNPKIVKVIPLEGINIKSIRFTNAHLAEIKEILRLENNNKIVKINIKN